MKKEEKTELTKANILAAAMEEFGTNGYGGSTLNNICAKGIAKGLLKSVGKSSRPTPTSLKPIGRLHFKAYRRKTETGTNRREKEPRQIRRKSENL